ncbi:hypothetical protein [Streptomyces sp. NPDC005435]|uniref:hypothetical protein n=1 Tax=Streptomyces sp. NPDC005435 TaxID=3154464 RepID=UPI003451D854
MPDQQPAQPYGQLPPIIINNNVSSFASAGAFGGGVRRRRQSFWVHFWLLLFTAGLGNVVYAMHISRWNRDRGL